MSLREEILAGGFDLESRDVAAIATALSTGRTKRVSYHIGYGSVMDALGADVGAELLDTLEMVKATNPKLKWAWTLLDRGELDVGMESTREQVDALVTAGLMSAEAGEKLKSLAESPETISPEQVKQEMYNDEWGIK